MNATPSIERFHNYHDTLAFPFSAHEATRSRIARVRRRVPHTMACHVVGVQDCWVLNTAVATRVEAHVRLVNHGTKQANGHLRLDVVDPSNQRVLTSTAVPLNVAGGKHVSISRMLNTPAATVWTFDHQNVFQLVVSWKAQGPGQSIPLQRLDFAFLEFAVEGFGRDEMFRLRNRKARLSAVIPWSRWAANGLTPVGEMKESGVTLTN